MSADRSSPRPRSARAKQKFSFPWNSYAIVAVSSPASGSYSRTVCGAGEVGVEGRMVAAERRWRQGRDRRLEAAQRVVVEENEGTGGFRIVSAPRRLVR